jgi:dipeptidase D
MSAIKNLDPKPLWGFFHELTQIPRPSKKEQGVIAFMKKFGESLGLKTEVDAVGNVLIRKPATRGMENRKTVILQGHLDMVPQKNSDKTFDFDKDPIESLVDGEWVKANGTTLGSDNGIGVAAAMSVIASRDLVHGPIEALFTIDEETGMTGAFGLQPGWLKGDILLNLDSEDEGELYVGCAGGTDINVVFKTGYKVVPKGHVAYKLAVTGLKGGHSGIDINLYKGNANKLLNRFLWHATRRHHLCLAEIDGGGMRNAIPREAFATVTFPKSEEKSILEWVKKMESAFKEEYGSIEPNLRFEAKPAELPEKIIHPDVQKKFVNAVYACPNDVFKMSNDIPGLVETSNNLAILKSEEGILHVKCLMRSSVEAGREAFKPMVLSVFEPAGAEIEFTGEYPGWKPNPDSPILKTMKKVYERDFGKTPDIKAIHAGLECGILGGVYPGLDMISFGPTIRFPHSPDEKVNIPTVKKFWDFLVATLKEIPIK